MKKQTKLTRENYLERIPIRKMGLNWETDPENKVTLLIENKGIMNKIFQRFFKKPRVTHVHLDEMGSFIWPIIDGKSDIISLGKAVSEHFGEKAEPLYERLAQFFGILESYNFIEWKN